MSYGIPFVWLFISGVFFLLGIVVFAAILVALYKMQRIVEDLRPRVDSLTTKVETLVAKVDRVAEKMDGVASTLKESVDGMNGSAKSITGFIDMFVKGAVTKVDRISPFLGAALAAVKLFSAVKDMSHRGRPHKPLPRKPHGDS